MVTRLDLVNCITIIFSKKYDALPNTIPCMMLQSLCIGYVDTGYIYLYQKVASRNRVQTP